MENVGGGWEGRVRGGVEVVEGWAWEGVVEGVRTRFPLYPLLYLYLYMSTICLRDIHACPRMSTFWACHPWFRVSGFVDGYMDAVVFEDSGFVVVA